MQLEYSSMPDWEDLHDMELMAELKVEMEEARTFIITRVPGGWIFTHYEYEYKDKQSAVFVPEPIVTEE